MVLLQKHSEEIYWLQRRIRLIEELDRLLQAEDISDAEYQINPLVQQFEKVKDPADLVDRLKDIYGKKLR